ncbi:hypothetical protein RDV77_02400 [Porphyromonadaceae sp. NP-X]|jgi:hypothetical protein|nr:hypothetical protein [Porphyromonadaceae sp. NP-X]
MVRNVFFFHCTTFFSGEGNVSFTVFQNFLFYLAAVATIAWRTLFILEEFYDLYD